MHNKKQLTDEFLKSIFTVKNFNSLAKTQRFPSFEYSSTQDEDSSTQDEDSILQKLILQNH